MDEEVVQQESIEDFMGAQFDALEAEAPADEPEVVVSGDTEPDVQPDDAAEAADTDVASESDSGPEDQTITAPQSMSVKDREDFYKLPPENQKWISDRVKAQESDYTRKTMNLAEQRKNHDKLEQAIAPRRQQLAMDGMDEGTAVGQLFALSDFANSDPVAFTRYLFKQRGDPQILAMQQRLQGFENYFTEQQSQEQNSQNAAVSGVIEKFADANPFYAELEGDMIPIVASLRSSQPGLTSDQYLGKAYKMALAGNDDVFAKVEVDRKAKTESDRIAKAKKSAAAAKKAGGTNIRTSGSLAGNAAKAKNVDDFIGALVDERMTA
jgi:hypothetical protein